MTVRDEIGKLASAFGGLAADLKDNQDKLLAHARALETAVAERSAELAQEKDCLTISVADRTAQLNAANDELRNRSAELLARNQEITLFSRMNDFLQTSATEAEAYSIISKTVPQLFPEDSGGVFVISASRDVLEAAAVWGPRPPANLVFASNECWAHRRGQVLWESATSAGALTSPTTGTCTCACRCSPRARCWVSCTSPTAR